MEDLKKMIGFARQRPKEGSVALTDRGHDEKSFPFVVSCVILLILLHGILAVVTYSTENKTRIGNYCRKWCLPVSSEDVNCSPGVAVLPFRAHHGKKNGGGRCDSYRIFVHQR